MTFSARCGTRFQSNYSFSSTADHIPEISQTPPRPHIPSPAPPPPPCYPPWPPRVALPSCALTRVCCWTRQRRCPLRREQERGRGECRTGLHSQSLSGQRRCPERAAAAGERARGGGGTIMHVTCPYCRIVQRFSSIGRPHQLNVWSCLLLMHRVPMAYPYQRSYPAKCFPLCYRA